jgi:hypothetical protein
LPLWQVSLWVQASPSLQALPLALVGLEQTPVLESHVPTEWHWSSAVQTTLFEPTQVPAWHVSVCVHALPSEQGVLSALLGFEHAPVEGSQVPALWHWSLAVQETAVPAQAPAVHTSLVVHGLPSLQAVLSALLMYWQVPVVRLQLTLVWHWPGAAQSASFEQPQLLTLGVHTPAWQVSPLVQARPSSQVLPVSAVCAQAPVEGSHAALWH